MRSKKLLFFMLYFFEGAPIGLIWWTLPTYLSDAGTPIDTLTAILAAANVPWAFKFLFAPVVDRYLFRHRHYALGVAFFQGGLLLTLFLLSGLSLDSSMLFWVIVCLSLFAASQDVVIDAWAIASVEKSERGAINGAMQAGMLSGRWLFGPGLLLLGHFFEWRLALYPLMGLTVFSCLLLIFRSARSRKIIAPQITKLSYKSLGFIFRKKFFLLALIALLSGFALESVTGVASPLLVDLGYNPAQVGGLLSGTLFVMLGGSLLGGWASDRWGAFRVFMIAGLVLAPTIVLFGFLFSPAKASPVLWSSPSHWGVFALLYISYLLVGIFTSSSYTFYMNQSHGKMEASKFTFLMAITNLCEAQAAYLTGQLTAQHSYLVAFTVCALISLLGFGLLRGYTRQKSFLAR